MSAESSTCSTCRFNRDDACHRYPPMWALWPSDNQHPIMYNPYATFPHIGPSDWCGEHQLSDALKEKDAPPAAPSPWQPPGCDNNALVLQGIGQS